MNSSHPQHPRPHLSRRLLRAVVRPLFLLALLCAALVRADVWTWSMSGIHGGGMGQVIAVDPFNANGATLGGDSWGVYNTTNAGDQWFAATKGLGVAGQQQPTPGDFFFMGMAYSQKYPGRVYCLTGRLEDPTQGNFGYVEGDAYTVITRAVRGGESTASGGARNQLPRPTGKRVVIDYSGGTEYIYVGTGDGGGVQRTTDGGSTWTTIGLSGLASAITGMCLDPSDSTALYVSTRGNKAYRLTNIRGAGAQTQLTAAPTRVEEVTAIGSTVYASANTSGIYKLSSNGTVWTPLGGTFFTATGASWSAIGGTGSTVYAGCAYPAAGESIAKSTDGGSTWAWVTGSSQIGLQVWGRSENWWLGVYQPNTLPGGSTYVSNDIEVDQFNSNIVYSCGRSGVWKSEDGGSTWRPAMNGLGGTMHNNILAATSGGQVWTDDVDWNGETTTDYFATASQQNPPTFGAAKLTLTKGGHTYALVQNAIRDFTVDGVSIADEFFQATCVTADDIDVSSDGNYIYVAQYGGGVLVGHKTATPTVTVAATIASATEPSTDGLYTLTATPAPLSPITVNIAMSGTATNGTDYTTIPATVTIGTSGTATVPLTVIDDYLVEGTETAILTVQTGTGYVVGSPSTATVSIADNDTGTVVGPFLSQDIGSPAIAGSASLSGGVYTIAGAGTDIYGTSDQFQFAHEAWSGDGTIVAQVTQVQNTHAYAKAGVMFRDGLAPNAANGMNTLLATAGVQLLHRASTGASTTSDFTIPGFTAPYWVRLDRHGSTFTGYDSPDGLEWFLTGSVNFTLPTATQVGLAVTSHNASALNTAKFANVSVSALPSWTSADVGTTGAAGSGSLDYTTGLYTVNGAGANIWTGTDAFQYYYQTWTGDGVFIAEVKSVQNTQTYAKAGIMIRKSLSASSAHALVDITPGNGAEFNRRINDGDTTTVQDLATGLAAPYWIKLVRTGNSVSAYTSPDGGTWTQLGSAATISLGTGSVDVGLVVCSHVAGTLCTATFDSVFFAP